MRFVIKGDSWRLQFVRPNDTRLEKEDGTLTLGVTDNATKTVYVNDSLNDYMTQKVISHELVHVACFEYGYVVSRETEEYISDFLASYGREIFRVVDELTERIFKRA